MGEDSWKVARVFLEWGIFVACIVALVQGAGGLRPFSVFWLAFFCAAAATIAMLEHGWHKPWFKGIGLVIIIWGFSAWLAYKVWPIKEVLKITPVTSWFPASIKAGDPLTNQQLNAVFEVDGIPIDGEAVYNPTYGTTLAPGADTLSVAFTPTNDAYGSVSKTVTVKVNPPRAAQTTPSPSKNPPNPVVLKSTSANVPSTVGETPYLQVVLRNVYGNIIPTKLSTIMTISPFPLDPVEQEKIEDDLWSRLTAGFKERSAYFEITNGTDGVNSQILKWRPLSQLDVDRLSNGEVLYFAEIIQDAKTKKNLIELCGHVEDQNRFVRCHRHNYP